jgi:hypothetical protein
LPTSDDGGRSPHGRRTAFPPGFDGSCEGALDVVSAEHGARDSQRATDRSGERDAVLAAEVRPALAEVQSAMEALTQAYSPDTLAPQAYALYEQFRPDIPEGQKGWGTEGHLDLDAIRALAD